jgi:hypothetical protein
VRLLGRVSPTGREHGLLATLAILDSHPFQRALLGGQTVPATLLFLCGLYASLRQQRHLAAGVWLGLLCFKPPVAIVFLLLMAWMRWWRVLAACAATQAVLGVVSAVIAGWRWPLDFTRLVTSDYYQRNADIVDGVRSLSIPGIASHLLGVDSRMTLAITLAAGFILLGLLLRLWRGIDVTCDAFPLQFSAAVTVMLLTSPHALFYESSLLALPVILLVDHWRTQPNFSAHRQRWLLLGIAGSGFTWLFADAIGFEPLVFSVLAVGALTVIALRQVDGVIEPDAKRLAWQSALALATKARAT